MQPDPVPHGHSSGTAVLAFKQSTVRRPVGTVIDACPMSASSHLCVRNRPLDGAGQSGGHCSCPLESMRLSRLDDVRSSVVLRRRVPVGTSASMSSRDAFDTVGIGPLDSVMDT